RMQARPACPAGRGLERDRAGRGRPHLKTGGAHGAPSFSSRPTEPPTWRLFRRLQSEAPPPMDSPRGATLRWGMDPIAYERRGAAALVRIVRPERRNAIDGATADALHAAFARFVADEGARVLVLAGDANAFRAGADLKAIETLRDRDEGPLGITRLLSPK